MIIKNKPTVHVKPIEILDEIATPYGGYEMKVTLTEKPLLITALIYLTSEAIANGSATPLCSLINENSIIPGYRTRAENRSGAGVFVTIQEESEQNKDNLRAGDHTSITGVTGLSQVGDAITLCSLE
jgi:hypothetical protein